MEGKVEALLIGGRFGPEQRRRGVSLAQKRRVEVPEVTGFKRALVVVVAAVVVVVREGAPPDATRDLEVRGDRQVVDLTERAADLDWVDVVEVGVFAVVADVVGAVARLGQDVAEHVDRVEHADLPRVGDQEVGLRAAKEPLLVHQQHHRVGP